MLAALLAGILCGTVPAGAAAQATFLPILVYHQVRNDPSGPPDSLEAISLERFEAQMRHLSEQGYVSLSAQEVVDFVGGKRFAAARIVAIHFDDGWKSAQLALPVLERHGFKATFWLIAGKGIGWPHMDWDEIMVIARSPRYDIGSHSMTHPWRDGDTLLDWMAGRVPGKGAEAARWELVESRRVLEERLGRPVRHFAWPRGLYSEDLIDMARTAGYIGSFTVDDGVNRPGDSALRLRRTMVHGACDERAFAQILRDGVYRDCGSASGGAAPAAQSNTGSEGKR